MSLGGWVGGSVDRRRIVRYLKNDDKYEGILERGVWNGNGQTSEMTRG